MAELASAVRQPRRYLHNRWIDFMTLGGGSLIVMAALAVLYPQTEEARTALFAVTIFLSHFVNNPHFAYSYQIFYRNFLAKGFSRGAPLRFRYQLAGVVVPAAMVAFFAIAIAKGSAALLGLAANVMFFTVGWHYAKQGFGILMVDAAHSHTRFRTDERKRLIRNTHLTWVTYWLVSNDALAAHDYWGLTYLMFDTPDTLLAALLAAVAVSTLVGRAGSRPGVPARTQLSHERTHRLLRVRLRLAAGGHVRADSGADHPPVPLTAIQQCRLAIPTERGIGEAPPSAGGFRAGVPDAVLGPGRRWCAS